MNFMRLELSILLYVAFTFISGLFLDMFFGKKPPAPASGKPGGKTKWLSKREDVWNIEFCILKNNKNEI